MSRRKVVLLAVGILIGGFCAALPFRHSPGPSPAAPNRGAPGDAVVTQTFKPAPPTAVVPEAPQVTPTREVTVQQNQVRPSIKATTPALAILAPDAEFASISPPVASEAAPAPSEPPHVAESAVPERGAAWLERPILRGWRRHRIEDGDTLPKLAQDYLGDPAREGEIFANNRDVLANPEILPIGRWLRIPPPEPK